MAYTKLFKSIITSSIWGEDDRTRLVWITMLAYADHNGEVQGSVPGLARIAGVPVDDCRKALSKFLAPDPDSRTPDDEGRRIEVIDGGWFLINYAKYRAMASAEDLREAESARKRRYRDRLARNKRPGHVPDLSRDVPRCPEKQREEEQEEQEELNPPAAAAPSPSAKENEIPPSPRDAGVSASPDWLATEAEFPTLKPTLKPKHPPNDGPNDTRRNVADFLVPWQGCRSGINGVLHVAGIPKVWTGTGTPDVGYLTPEAAWQQFYDGGGYGLGPENIRAIDEMMTERPGATLEAIERINRGEIKWGSPAIEIRKLPGRIDKICGGQEELRVEVERKKKTRGQKSQEAGENLSEALGNHLMNVVANSQRKLR